MAQSHLQITLNWVIKELKKPKAQRSEDIFADKPADISRQDFKSDLRFITKSISKVYKRPITTPMLFAMEREDVEKALSEWGWKADSLSPTYNDFIFDKKIGGFICKNDPGKMLMFGKNSKSFHIVKFLYDNLNQLVTTKKIAEYVASKINDSYDDAKVRNLLNNSIEDRFTEAQINIGLPFEIHDPRAPNVGHKGIMMRKLIK